MTAARTSATGANAVATSVTGDTTRWPSHSLRIDIESLPTGMAIPSAGHSSSPTARTASASRVSSPATLAAAIQLHDSRTSARSATGAAIRLVTASATAIRADAAADSSASAGRSPTENASPATVPSSAGA